jgi:hypothetical protein
MEEMETRFTDKLLSLEHQMKVNFDTVIFTLNRNVVILIIYGCPMEYNVQLKLN